MNDRLPFRRWMSLLLGMVLTVFAAGAIASTSTASAAEHPNVVFLFSDDQRFDTIHALGNSEIQTPNLDRLVDQGFTFTHAFCMGSNQGAVCVPSRAMMLTGRSLFRCMGGGANDAMLGKPTKRRYPEPIPADFTLFPQAMHAAGYETFEIGKWHNDPASLARGFDDGAAIFLAGMTAKPLRVPIFDFDPSGKYPKEAMRNVERFSTEIFADAAIEYLTRPKHDKPFFLYLPFNSPHDPRVAPKEFADRYRPENISLPPNYMPVHPFNNGEMLVRDEQLASWPRSPEIVKRHIADYYAMITHLDAQIGRVLEALDKTGLRDNTIIIFSSDHGLAVGRHGLLGKQSLYDHSMRAPLIFSGPGIPRGKKSDALCYLFDIYPTVCELAEAPIPPTVEGQSLTGIMDGRVSKVRGAVFGAYRDVQRSVRTERWKLIRYPRINKSQLFDLVADPDEMHDLSGDSEQAGRLPDITKLLADNQRQFGDSLPLSTDHPDPLQIELKMPAENGEKSGE